MRALIAHGANPEAADANGETPLGLALEHPAVERWLDWRDWQRPQSRAASRRPAAAAAAGALASVQRLLELGFAVDTRDDQGATALLRACGAGHRDIAACLLDAGADPSLAARSGVTRWPPRSPRGAKHWSRCCCNTTSRSTSACRTTPPP